MSVVVVDGGKDGGGVGKEPLLFVDGAKWSVGVCRCSTKSGVTVGMYSISYTATVKLVWLNW